MGAVIARGLRCGFASRFLGEVICVEGERLREGLGKLHALHGEGDSETGDRSRAPWRERLCGGVPRGDRLRQSREKEGA